MKASAYYLYSFVLSFRVLAQGRLLQCRARTCRRRLAVNLSLITFLFAAQLSAAAQSSHPVPPGIRQADQIEAQSEKSIPPTLTPHRTIDLGKLKRDADELAALAQSVPQDIDQTAKGTLPKDLSTKLKRIEKLAKQLRGQVSP